jgi:hypothetical protein
MDEIEAADEAEVVFERSQQRSRFRNRTTRNREKLSGSNPVHLEARQRACLKTKGGNDVFRIRIKNPRLSLHKEAGDLPMASVF